MAASINRDSPPVPYYSPVRIGTPKTDEDSLSEKEEVETFNLNSEKPTERELETLCTGLKNNTLINLFLSYVSNPIEFFEEIIPSLEANRSLQKISLEIMNLSGIPLEKMLYAIRSKPIKILIIQNCQLQERDILLIAETLPHLPNLVELDLSHNKISTQLISLCQTIPQCKALSTLNLSRCFIQDSHILSFAKVLESLPSLTSVDLSGNNILRLHSAFARTIEKNPKITDFKINTRGICPIFQCEHRADKIALRKISKALQKNRSLSSFHSNNIAILLNIPERFDYWGWQGFNSCL